MLGALEQADDAKLQQRAQAALTGWVATEAKKRETARFFAGGAAHTHKKHKHASGNEWGAVCIESACIAAVAARAR